MSEEVREVFKRRVREIEAMEDAFEAQKAAKELRALCADLESQAARLRGRMVVRYAADTGQTVREAAKKLELSSSQVQALKTRGRKHA
jgi:DNA-directed RNA polymerase specialized sigma24 family protein